MSKFLSWSILVLLASACQSYTSFDEMASEMCKGRAVDVRWNQWDTNAVVVDVRSAEEFGVSHADGALHCPWQNNTVKGWEQLPKDQPIVVYCSVGKRSELAAEFLMDHGFQSVTNVYGGLFGAFNAAQAIDQDHLVMQRIHGYNTRWGQWITRGEVVYE